MNISRHVLSVMFAVVAAGNAGYALASDGAVLIDQRRALQGGITPGDAPGFPITLSQNGRYKLIGNLSVPFNKKGIDVTADTVTIDFNGFEMNGNNRGWMGVQALLDSTTGASHAVTLLNGTITGFRYTPVFAEGYGVIRSMRIINNKQGGPSLGSGRVADSTIAQNGGDGIGCGWCLIERNVISNNGTAGVVLTSGTVIGNTISGNASYGIVAKPHGLVGFGGNTIYANNKGGEQIGSFFISPLQSNACDPSCQH